MKSYDKNMITIKCYIILFIDTRMYYNNTNSTYILQIAAVYYYLCVVALQFIVPVIICLFFTFLYKTLGKKIISIILKNIEFSPI